MVIEIHSLFTLGDDVKKPNSKGKVITTSSDDVPEDVRELKKAADAIHMSASTSLVQRKLINSLVYYAYSELGTKEFHQVSLTHLARDIGFDSNNQAFLKKQLKQMIEISAEWNVLKNGKESWKACSFLTEVDITDGVVTYMFPPSLRKMLDNPEVFGIINMQIQRLFDSVFAHALYENANRFRSIGHTGFITVENLRKLLGVSDSKLYAEFKYLNKCILKPAINEVNEVSDIILTPEFKTLGRKVSAIDFKIKVKQTISADHPFSTTDYSKPALLQRMLDLPISEKQARQYIDTMPGEYLAGNLDVVEDRKRRGTKVGNMGAYFKSALEEDWRVARSPSAVAEEERLKAEELKKSEEEAKQRAAQEVEELKNKEAAEKRKEARIWFDSQPERMREKCEAEFVTYLESDKKLLSILVGYRKNKLTKPKEILTFENWLLDNYF